MINFVCYIIFLSPLQSVVCSSSQHGWTFIIVSSPFSDWWLFQQSALHILQYNLFLHRLCEYFKVHYLAALRFVISIVTPVMLHLVVSGLVQQV